MGEESKVRVNKFKNTLTNIHAVPTHPALWIPAYAGMTVKDARMTVKDARMTVMVTGMTGGRHTGFKAVSTGWGAYNKPKPTYIPSL